MKGQRSYKFQYVMPDRKVCQSCGIEKDLGAYKTQWLLPDGRKKRDAHSDDCSDCARQKMLDYIDQHPDYVGSKNDNDDNDVPTVV